MAGPADAAVPGPLSDRVSSMAAPFTAGELVARVQFLLGPQVRRAGTESRVLRHPGRAPASPEDVG
jgi:hypothetical protein